MADLGLFVTYILETVYDHLDPISRKSLSATCRFARAIYKRYFFKDGILVPAKIKLGGPVLSANVCACGRGRAFVTLLGMRSISSIGMIIHCNVQRCRNATITASYHNAIQTLLVDSGRGYYVPPSSYEHFLEKAILVSTCHGDAGPITHVGGATQYAKMRALHDSMISAFVENALGGVTSCGQQLSPKYSLISDWITFDHLRIDSKNKRKGTVSYVITTK